MRLMRAFAEGLRPSSETLLPGLLFWAASLLPAWVAAAPLRAGLGAALDRFPAASELSGGGGVDLLAELGMTQPGMWAAGFAVVLAGALLAAGASLFAASGAYARAVQGEGNPWARFWSQAVRFLLPSTVVLLLNAILWCVVGLVPFLVLVGLGQAWKGETDPAVDWNLFWAGALCAAVLWGLFRAGTGFGRAWAARQGSGPNAAKSFLKGLAFSLRRLPQTQAITWGFALARLSVLYLAVGVLSPGFSTGGAVAGSLALAQVGYFVAGYLRAAEIRCQVAYLGPLPAEPAKAAPAPPPPVAGESAPADLTPESALEG